MTAIRAVVASTAGTHDARVETTGRAQTVAIPGREGGGSAVNGGELLFLALATCYCNDVYREALARGLRIDRVEVTVEGTFGGPGDPARDVTYGVRVESPEPEEAVRRLLQATDSVAEIQNTLRQGVPVVLNHIEVRGHSTP
jgi:uncharacterized OsmC-like protein